MLKKLTVAMILAVMLLITAAPAFATPSVAPVPTAQDLLTRLNSEEQSRTNVRTLALQAQGLQAAADTAKSVYDAAQKAAADALLEAQKADTTARGSLPSFVVVVAQATGSATWKPIADLLPGNALVQTALNAARTAEGLQTVANTKATEWGVAKSAATTALDKAIAAMPVPPTDPAIARLEGELKEAKTAQVKAEGEVVQLRKELTTEKARADRFETRVGELEKKLAAAPAPVTPAPAAPAAPTTTPTKVSPELATAIAEKAVISGQLEDAKTALTKLTTERDVARVEAKANAEAKAKAEVALTAAQTEVAELRKQLEAAKAPQTQQQATVTASATTPAVTAPAPAAAAPAPAAPAAPAPAASPATVASSATAAPAPAATQPTEPMATKASVDALEKRINRNDDRLVKAEDAVKGVNDLTQAVKALTAMTEAQTMEIANLRTQIVDLGKTQADALRVQSDTITALQDDLKAFQTQLRWTWIILGGLLLIGLLFVAVIRVRRWLVVLRTTRRAAGASSTSGTAPVTGGARTVT